MVVIEVVFCFGLLIMVVCVVDFGCLVFVVFGLLFDLCC